MKNIVYHIDAFTSDPFKGNPAGVCFVTKETSDDWMQKIANELNLSETAFVIPGVKQSEIRYFTPEAEVPLCGHATLSASHIMYETGLTGVNEEILFKAKAGELKISKEGTWIKMNFPAYQLTQIPADSIIGEIIGTKPVEVYSCGFGWTMVLVDNEKLVRAMKPDFIKMRNSDYADMIVTAKSEEKGFDFCVRCFAPALGINEDPVTGSAHCALAPFWNMKTGKTKFVSHQVSKRSGILKVELLGDRVEISGQAVTIIKGELFV
jgi:PhzF family phenazine biosynthesis protein